MKKQPNPPPLDALAAPAEALGAAVSDAVKSMAGLTLPPDALAKLQADYLGWRPARHADPRGSSRRQR